MDRYQLHELLQKVATGEVGVDEAITRLSLAPFDDLGYAKPDFQRGVRTGASEVIYGEGKTAQQIAGIVSTLTREEQRRVLVTRIDSGKVRDVMGLLADDERLCGTPVFYDAVSRILTIGGKPTPNGNGIVVVACAGTSDLYCAEEAALTAEMMGSRVERVYDVGVAGLHRLLAYAPSFQRASAIVAVAGMEGALASVIGGLCACPVIACPTSVGYGASLGGIAALLAMLNSCASGISVVNIDNGFGAGFQAALIDHARVTYTNGEER